MKQNIITRWKQWEQEYIIYMNIKRIKTPVGYGLYDLKNNMWLCFGNQTHKNIIKNKSINNYNMEKTFTDLYERNEWGNDNNIEYAGSSGPGSTTPYNVEYIKFLKNFINNNLIKNVVDLGCGDCKCLKSIYDDLDVQYTGYDCYKNIVEYNLKHNSSDRYKFIH